MTDQKDMVERKKRLTEAIKKGIINAEKREKRIAYFKKFRKYSRTRST